VKMIAYSRHQEFDAAQTHEVTTGTHLRPGVWLERLLEVKKELGQTHGKLFSRNLRRAKLCEFEDDCYRMIEQIQDTTDQIPPKVDVRNEYARDDQKNCYGSRPQHVTAQGSNGRHPSMGKRNERKNWSAEAGHAGHLHFVGLNLSLEVGVLARNVIGKRGEREESDWEDKWRE
jgi:hypothetical protein